MTEKIEWYKEVLEIEPNSRLFFPLARMLADASREDEALLFLQQGTTRHPEYLEARLFYIELLYKTGAGDVALAELDQIEKHLLPYQGFWQAWSAAKCNKESTNGLELAFSLLSATLADNTVTLQDILRLGLNALAEKQGISVPQKLQAEKPQTEKPNAEPVLQASEEKQLETVVESASESKKTLPPVAAEIHVAPVEPKPVESKTAQSKSAPVVESASALYEPSENTDASPVLEKDTYEELSQQKQEDVSLRTRSMAEVLAEQGDIQGAIAIYQEILDTTTHPDSVAELQLRMRSLASLLENSGEKQSSETAAQPAPAPTGKDKLITLLEALAERVEMRT